MTNNNTSTDEALKERDELARELERLSKRTYDFQPTLFDVLRKHEPRGQSGYDWDDREAFEQMRQILLLVPRILTALRARATMQGEAK